MIISNLKINKEIFSFDFKDNYISLVNSFRRTIINGFDMYYMNVTEVSSNLRDVKFEQVHHAFKYIYINHNKLKKYGNDLSKIKFSLDIDSTSSDNIILSDKIIFSGITKSIIRDDLHICTLKKNSNIHISGSLMKGNMKPIANIGYNYDDMNDGSVKGTFTLSMLELYTCSTILKLGALLLQKQFADLKKYILNNKPISIIYGIRYDIDSFDHTELNLLCEHINKDKNNIISALGPCVNIILGTFMLNINSPDKKEDELIDILCKYIDEIISKIHDLYKQIDKKTKDKSFNVIIDNY